MKNSAFKDHSHIPELTGGLVARLKHCVTKSPVASCIYRDFKKLFKRSYIYQTNIWFILNFLSLLYVHVDVLIQILPVLSCFVLILLRQWNSKFQKKVRWF